METKLGRAWKFGDNVNQAFKKALVETGATFACKKAGSIPYGSEII